MGGQEYVQASIIFAEVSHALLLVMHIKAAYINASRMQMGASIISDVRGPVSRCQPRSILTGGADMMSERLRSRIDRLGRLVSDCALPLIRAAHVQIQRPVASHKRIEPGAWSCRPTRSRYRPINENTFRCLTKGETVGWLYDWADTGSTAPM